MKKSICIFLFILSIFNSCNNENSVQDNKKDRLDTKSFPTIIDTLDYNKYTFRETANEKKWLSKAKYHFIYIGPFNDTLLIHPKAGSLPPPPPPYGNNNIEYKYPEYINITEEFKIENLNDSKYQYWDTVKIEVLIDTNNVFYNSYPVLLKNENPDTIIIGYGNYIPLLMEAKDSTGNWNSIEMPFIYDCGNGINEIILPPDYVTLTLAPIFNGSYKTKLRLTIGNNISSEFTGYINYSQFESRFSKIGS